jgi:hypothetical protein
VGFTGISLSGINCVLNKSCRGCCPSCVFPLSPCRVRTNKEDSSESDIQIVFKVKGKSHASEHHASISITPLHQQLPRVYAKWEEMAHGDQYGLRRVPMTVSGSSVCIATGYVYYRPPLPKARSTDFFLHLENVFKICIGRAKRSSSYNTTTFVSLQPLLIILDEQP